jgi:acyl carrier protein
VRALPSPEQQAPARELVPPRTPDEEKLALIWQEVLKLERVGVTDDFFELGGHSLLATQIISRIRSRFMIQMPLLIFLQNPTIAALAGQIGQFPAIESEQEEMTRLLLELEGISEDEAERLLAAELNKGENR